MNYQKGKFVHIKLRESSSNSIYISEYPQSLLEKYLGGRGFTTWHLYKNKDSIPKNPLDENNIICISSGLLAGTSFPSSGRTTVAVLKSPVTGFFGDGNFGGHFGPALRQAGIDMITVTGRSQNPIYIHISNTGEVRIVSASQIWTLSIAMAEAFLKFRYGPQAKCLLIGPGGTTRCFSAIPLCENRAAGGGGTGAVFGSKNLKGIVVDYDIETTIPEDDPKQFKIDVDEAEEKIRSHPVYDMFKKYGTTSLIEIHSTLKYFPTKNFTKSVWKKWKKISGKRLLNSWIKQDPNFETRLEEMANEGKLGCRNCPIVCSNPNKIEYETLNCLGAKIGISDLDTIQHLNLVYMNDGGIDVIQTTSVIAALMQMYEDGISHYKFEWADKDHVKRWLSDFINPDQLPSTCAPLFRTGFKSGLIKLKQTGKIDTHNSIDDLVDEYYINTKGMGMSGVFPTKQTKGVALAVATSSRGADHLRSLPTLATYADWYLGNKGIKKLLKMIRMPLYSIGIMKYDAKLLVKPLYQTYVKTFGVPKEIADEWEKFGFLTDQNKTEGWGSMIKFTQEMYAVSDALSICRFTSPWRFGVGPELLARATEHLTGILFEWKDLLRCGERINALERDLLFYYGKPVSDTISKRFFKGKNSVDEFQFEQMKLDYYRRCNYNNLGRPILL